MEDIFGVLLENNLINLLKSRLKTTGKARLPLSHWLLVSFEHSAYTYLKRSQGLEITNLIVRRSASSHEMGLLLPVILNFCSFKNESYLGVAILEV